jgi:gamma-glutamyltranspeptidase / glutathione hydrolase
MACAEAPGGLAWRLPLLAKAVMARTFNDGRAVHWAGETNRINGMRCWLPPSDKSTAVRQKAFGSSRLRLTRTGAVLGLLAFLPGCGVTEKVLGSGGPSPGQPGYVVGFLGGVVAEEPQAALAGREVLSAGGTAADAAVAVGLTLAVTLPSRAGLGGGGACLAFAAGGKAAARGAPEAIMFTPIASTAANVPADRPAAVPMLARGLFLLHARYGSRPFEDLLSSAERLAESGVPASRALVKDLALVAGPLLLDPGARAVFSRDGVPLAEGQTLRQPELGATLAQLHNAGVGDLYLGPLAHQLEQASALVGGPISLADLRAALPKVLPPLVRPYHNDRVAFLPPPADGGLAANAAFDVLAGNPDDIATASERALAAAVRYRAGGATPEVVLASTDSPAGYLAPLPASTTLATMDRLGNAVVCALTMDNLFGTGRIIPGLGFMPAASPAAVPPPLLSAGMVWNDKLKAFRAEAGGSGQAGAPLAVAVALINALRTNRPMSVPVPDPGRANVIACSRYLPGDSNDCAWASDPREAGLALGAN